MVGEFPELQGVIGRYYATAQGEGTRCAQAIEEHWMPRAREPPYRHQNLEFCGEFGR